MRIFILLLSVSTLSCINTGKDPSILFEKALKNGCIFVEDVRIGGAYIGDYAICTIEEFKKRRKNNE